MNEEIRVLWKDALTSGEYKQGIGQLRNSADEFCCLGVLCDLYQRTTGKGQWSNSETFVDDSGDRSSGFLTQEVRKWAGLHNRSPQVNARYLHQMNDTRTPFVKIAELLDNL